ncbi:MAG: OmpP1/FadL family transporter [Hyphomicrobium sp.]|jgi:long-chain fatty acid transport protein
MFRVVTSCALRVGGCAVMASVAALTAAVGPAAAGGFAIREQSAEFQGMSFAGSAAGGSLSAMFWNPAATASRDGLNTETSMSLILADSDVTVTGSPYIAVPGISAKSGDIGPPAFVPSSYGNYQLTKDIYIGMGVNAPFGLKSDPTNYNYHGAVIAQKTELRTYNFNPTVAVRIAPGIVVGAGVQIETAEGRFSFATGFPTNPSTTVEGNGWGFGGTAGVMIDATPTTRIGIGYRSQMDQDIDGHISSPSLPAASTKTTLKLPDVATVSVRQIVSPVLRLNGTFEWTNWSRFEQLAVSGAAIPISLPFNWSDGYFVSAGVEYDIYPTLTGRAGVGYEWSPVDSPEKRSPGIPDDNRVWLSGGFSWQFTPTTTIDFAYTHLFVDDSTFVRGIPLLPASVSGEVESKIDIVSVGIKNHW